MIKVGSLFDGIGGWPLAAEKVGFVPTWSSEIEPFPITVTEQHFPQMKQLGNLTKINGAEVEPVDIITFGSPCQDLSIAGKREGLEGARSGLFGEAVRIIREMRNSTNGKYPRFAIWENVPGAFSSNKGLDFRTVLEEITETKIPMPSSGKWANSGMVRSNRGEAAWRVLDAQYWGVPQRRKRIFLIADFGGRCAGEILFKPESVQRYFAEGCDERKSITGDVTDSVRATSERNITFAKISSTLRAGAGAPKHFQDYTGRLVATSAAGFKPRNSAKARSMGYSEEQMPTLDTTMNAAVIVRMRSGKEGGGKGALVSEEKSLTLATGNDQIIFEPRSQDGTPRIHANGICPTLNTAQGGQRQPCIAYCIAGNVIDRKLENGGNGKGVKEEVSYTLNTIDRHAVAFPSTSFSQYIDDKVACTLRASGGNLGGGSENLAVANNRCIYKVRRLTPTECERLQGLPDNWTIDGSDTARYKALGNGMAQPCPDFIMQGIARILEEGK